MQHGVAGQIIYYDQEGIPQRLSAGSEHQTLTLTRQTKSVGDGLALTTLVPTWDDSVLQSSQQQEGVTVSGSRFIQWILYTRSQSTPTAVPIWQGTSWDDIGDWSTTIPTGTQPVWIGYGSATINNDGSLAQGGTTLSAQFDQQFSIDGVDWHSTQNSDDNFTRWRLTDGHYGSAIRITDIDNQWVQIIGRAKGYGITSSATSIRIESFPAIDIGAFDFLRFELEPFNGWDRSTSTSSYFQRNVRQSAIVAKDGSWPVNSTDDFNHYGLVYHATNGMSVFQLGYVDPLRLPANSGIYNNNTQTIGFSLRFLDSTRGDDVTDGQVNQIELTNFRGFGDRSFLHIYGFGA